MIVEVPNTEIAVEDTLDVSVGSCEVEVVDLADLAVTVSKKEYVITGDEIYIPMLYDDAPQWMKDLVQVVVDVAVDSSNQGLMNDLNAIVAGFATSYVPLNQYTQSIVDLSDEDGRLNALIETLNSNFSDGLSSTNAQIVSLQLTKASKDEVVAQVIQTIAAQLADNSSNIGATIGRIDQAITDETSARASSFAVLTSSLEDTNLDITANSTAVSTLNAYVGISNGTPNGTGLLSEVTALASDVTTLSTELDNGTNTWASADSNLENSLMTEISDEGARVESKFAYNSIVGINGVYKKSGFGLTTNYVSGSGTQVDPYVSEFWIDASRFKFTNSNITGSVAPFTIDASGTTPQIEFNGKVSFGNIYDQTIIQNGYINTGLIQANTISANQINTVGLIAENISANEIIGKIIIGSTINGAVINGAVVKASYLDLDGELEVLTNYHITPAMYNANPSLYTDAVYLSGTNEYRIPSLSTIREATLSQAITTPTTIYGAMWSYNTANVGNNLKAVKIRPTFNNQVSFELFRSVSSDTWFSEGFTYGRKNHFKLSLGTTTLVECALDLSYAGSYASGDDDLTIVTVSGQGFTTFVNQSLSYGESYNRTYSLDIGIGILSLNIICSGHDSEYSGPNQVTIIGTLTTGSKLLPFDWTSGRLKFEQIVAPSKPWYGSTSEFTVFSLNQSLYINNMT